VLRVLSQSEDVLDDQEEVQTVRAPSVSKKGGFFRAFRSSSSNRLPPIRGDAGMEQSLVHQIEGRDLKTQMHAFYTAYSKVWYPTPSAPSIRPHISFPAAPFSEAINPTQPTTTRMLTTNHQYLIMSFETLNIRFISAGLVAVLNPTNVARSGAIVGTDVFRFLTAHATTLGKDFKQRVRGALRMGQPISVDVRLSTHRSAVFRGDEEFVTHWTPMKNEMGVVTWVVLTMGSMVA